MAWGPPAVGKTLTCVCEYVSRSGSSGCVLGVQGFLLEIKPAHPPPKERKHLTNHHLGTLQRRTSPWAKLGGVGSGPAAASELGLLSERREVE